jgi:hypothetical protein
MQSGYQGCIGNLECTTILYGLAGLEFGRDFAGKASAHPQCMRSLTSPGASDINSSGFIPAHRTNVAVCFYKSLGFEVLGSATEWAPGRTMEDSDIVLRRVL